MKLGIYDPYLDTFGGGEKYMFDVAEYVSKKHDVVFFWNPKDNDMILEQSKKRFGITLNNISFCYDIFSVPSTFIEKYTVTRSFDAIIYLSDGSFPFLFGRKNILMFQQPVDWVQPNLLTQLKLRNINSIICNSQFTKKHIDSTFGSKKTRIIYPCVPSVKNKAITKQPIILSVGRFTGHTNMKKQEEMIDAFKMLSKNLKGWRLVLIGATQANDEPYFFDLQQKARGWPITLLKNIDREEIVSYYNKASIYWHAAGFSENIMKHPERAEHFGITTVEAMSAGCVPLVFAAGGQREIVTENVDGFTWQSIVELQTYTEKLAEDSKLIIRLAEKAEERAECFNTTVFDNNISRLLSL